MKKRSVITYEEARKRADLLNRLIGESINELVNRTDVFRSFAAAARAVPCSKTHLHDCIKGRRQIESALRVLRALEAAVCETKKTN